MERSHIETIKEAHAAKYAEEGDFERAREISTAQDIYSPITKEKEIHPEEEPLLKEINNTFNDIANDLIIINKEYAVAGERYNALMEETKLRLNEVQKNIAIEEERIKDLNMLCGDHSEFNTVETLTAEDFIDGDVFETAGVFTAKVSSESTVRLNVVDVQGNGYEGNQYVIKNNKFVVNSMNTSNRAHIVDGRVNSLYEYSRINGDKKEKARFSLLNFDDIEAECSITLRASSHITMLQVISESESLVLKEVSVSDDGAAFTPVMEESIHFNKIDEKYSNENYVFGSGLICFPSSIYVKITLQSGEHTEDKIAFEYYDAKGDEEEE